LCPPDTNLCWCSAGFVGPHQEATLKTVRSAQTRPLPTHPPGPRARPVGTVLLGLAVAGLAGCSSAGGPAHTAARIPAATHQGSALDAADLAALGDRQETSTLRPATGTVADAERALAATLPAPTAVSGYDRVSVGSALTFTARLLAATRLDRGYLCGPRSAAPATALGTPFLRTFLAKPGNGAAIEATIGSARKRDDCGALRWVGPGVVLGRQDWTVGAGGNGDLIVRWSGTAGYALADPQGHPEPWRLTGHAGYELARSGSGWALATWTGDTNTRIDPGWPHDVPIPDGYLPVPAAPPGDPAALAAVRGAAARWAQTASSTTTLDSLIAFADTGKSSHVTGTDTAAPARGDAETILTLASGKSTRLLHLDHGRRTLTQPIGTPTAMPGRTLPKRLAWLGSDNTTPGDGSGYTDDPFVLTALLARAGSAAPAACPSGLAAARCYTALAVTGASGDPLADLFTGAAHRAGRPYQQFDVGVDLQGRPAFVRVRLTVRTLGTPFGRLTGTTRFTGYATTPPPAPALPDPATVAPATDVDF